MLLASLHWCVCKSYKNPLVWLQCCNQMSPLYICMILSLKYTHLCSCQGKTWKQVNTDRFKERNIFLLVLIHFYVSLIEDHLWSLQSTIYKTKTLVFVQTLLLYMGLLMGIATIDGSFMAVGFPFPPPPPPSYCSWTFYLSGSRKEYPIELGTMIHALLTWFCFLINKL